MSKQKNSQFPSEEYIQSYLAKARLTRQFAYCPYSKFQVGAVVIGDDGKEYPGSNIENASYGLTICAERNAIVGAVVRGMKKIKQIFISADTARPCPPCGACRQFISEFVDQNSLIIYSNLKGDYVIQNMEQCLPGYFKKEDLDDHATRNGIKTHHEVKENNKEKISPLTKKITKKTKTENKKDSKQTKQTKNNQKQNKTK